MAPARRRLPAWPAACILLQAVVMVLGWVLMTQTNHGANLPRLPLFGAAPLFPAQGSVTATANAAVSKTPDLEIAEGCQPEHADELAHGLDELLSANSKWAACPTSDWLSKLQELSPGGTKVFVDIGCSQGYFSSALFSLWAPELGFRPARIRRLAPEAGCSACDECKRQVAPAAGAEPQMGLQVLCVEPDFASHASLVNLREHVFGSSEAWGVYWHLLHAAVSNSSSGSSSDGGGKSSSSDSAAARAGSGQDAKGPDLAPVVTVDQLLSMYSWQYVDVLKIDTGDDMPAIAGALASLAAGRVRVLTFKYGGVGLWGSSKLEDVVSRMDELSYACYFSGQLGEDGSLVRLTGCWHPAFEAHAGSSVVCVLRSHELYPHAERLSMRYHRHRQEYHSEPAAVAEAAAAAHASALENASAADARGEAAAEMEDRPGAAASASVTHLAEWAADPDRLSFQPPQSRCMLRPNGTARLPTGWQTVGMPYLFDTASMPRREEACPHCPDTETPPLCCGVCIFESRLCNTFYPGENRSGAVAQHLLDTGFRLRAFSPCELFARIRGRTLWFMGDSQTWHFFYSAECFLREFAPSLRRTPPVPEEENKKLITVTWPVLVPPLCLELVLGTRVCAVRVDSAAVLQNTVLPLLQKLTPNFQNDVMIFNTGLHYETPGDKGKPANESKLVTELAALAAWRQQHKAKLPQLVWMDAPVQHFSGPDGSYDGGQKPFKCRPLEAWGKGDPVVRAGGRRNIPLAPIIPQLADAHLRTWNDSVPLWNTHKPDECTHWCSPSAYHMWLYKLNDVLRDSGLGNAVHAPDRPPPAAAAVGD